MTARHEPTEKTKALVRTASGYGLPQKMIAVLAGVSEPTLVLYYAAELQDGVATATFKVAATLFHRATEGKDLGAAIFFLKCKADFREKHVLDDPNTKKTIVELLALSGIDDRPPAPEAYVDPPKETLQ